MQSEGQGGEAKASTAIRNGNSAATDASFTGSLVTQSDKTR
jgi:hypothetical protein